MKDDPTLLLGESELHAFVDGRLDAAARAAVQARLQTDAQAAEQVREWSAQRDALRALHREILREPVPPILAAAAHQLNVRNDRFGRWQRWAGMAASLVIAFAVGWAGHWQWSGAPASVAARAPARTFAHEAVIAHAVYTPEVRHPVEVDAKQQDHLVQWLSKRLNRPLKVPNLGAQGYSLVGGRLLPGEGGARAQFMYQNAAGQRLTLYVGAIDGKQEANETSFRFVEDGTVHGFYWVDEGFGYALSGELPRAALQDVATAVYRQLG